MESGRRRDEGGVDEGRSQSEAQRKHIECFKKNRVLSLLGSG